MSTYYGSDGKLHHARFDADKYWRKREQDCPYAEGKRCYLVAEPSSESCKGCGKYEVTE